MKLAFSTTATAVLAAALLLVAPQQQANAQVIVQDDIVDEAGINNLLSNFPTKLTRFGDFIDVPQSLYERLIGVVSGGATAGASSEEGGGDNKIPARRAYEAAHDHKDLLSDRSIVEGRIGVVYLKGDGQMRFTHDETGEETLIDVQPGRLVSWENMEYTHMQLPGQQVRDMLGPFTYNQGSVKQVGGYGGPSPPNTLFQAYGNTLIVRPNSLLTITAELVILKWDFSPGECRRLTRDNNVFVSCSTIPYYTRRLTKSHNKTTASTDTVFQKSSLFPNTWKPKLKYDTENDGATISWELTEDGTVLKKVYKFTWKVRIGRDVSSGDELDFFIDSDTGDSAIVTVTVK